MKKKDKYHVEYVEPYFYIFDDVGKPHFGFFIDLKTLTGDVHGSTHNKKSPIPTK